jgi:adenylosuccinate lyase
MFKNQRLSPIDGRYFSYTQELVSYLSEAALNRARVLVEIKWLIALAEEIGELPQFTESQKAALLKIAEDFDDSSVDWLKEKERITQHDVKAVEYFLHYEITKTELFNSSEMNKIKLALHFCCTSEDINNLSYTICIKGAVEDVWLPKLKDFVKDLGKMASEYSKTPLLSRTHGQPATPTTLGKELAVFIHRLNRQIRFISAQEYLGKINGATGTFGAHQMAVPQIDWPSFAKNFVENHLGLTYNPLTTQIESHDWQVELYDRMAHVGKILHNVATDIWSYISHEVFVQIPIEGTTGSSTMPHKINPIKFENAEANLEIADALFAKLSQTLATSRLQRDLTDSTTQRNISVAFAHSLIAITNLTQGIAKLKVNSQFLIKELQANPAVLSEAVQSVMRYAGIVGVENMENPYERLKEMTRGQEITLDSVRTFVKTLQLPKKMEQSLLDLTPETYLGYATWLTETFLEEL